MIYEVLVSCRNVVLLPYGIIKPFCELSSVRQRALREGEVGVHIGYKGKLIKIAPTNVSELGVEVRHYWCAEVPTDKLMELMETDTDYENNRAGRVTGIRGS